MIIFLPKPEATAWLHPQAGPELLAIRYKEGPGQKPGTYG